MSRRARRAQAEQRRDREAGQDGQFQEPQVVLLELVQVDVGEVVPECLEWGDERCAGVPAAVGEQRDAAGRGLHHDLPGREGHRRHEPRQVLTAGLCPAAEHRDHPHSGDGRHGHHDRLPRQRPVGEQHGGQHRPAAADREQPGQQADGGERLRGVPGQAGEEPEVPG